MSNTAKILMDAQLSHVAVIQTENRRLCRTLESPFLSENLRKYFRNEIEANLHKIEMLRKIHEWDKVA
jgi:hypothetical protein